MNWVYILHLVLPIVNEIVDGIAHHTSGGKLGKPGDPKKVAESLHQVAHSIQMGIIGDLPAEGPKVPIAPPPGQLVP